MTIAVMLPNLIRVGILIDFKLNQEFIAEMLCINREKPASTCNGNCYLSEQLAKTSEQDEDQAPNPQKNRQELVIYCIYDTHTGDPYPAVSASTCYSSYGIDYDSNTFLSGIFRPPDPHLI